MPLIAGLIAEHRAIEGEALRLVAVVAGQVPDGASVAAIRWRMAEALLDHCAREDRVIYDVLLNSEDPVAADLAWRYREDHGAIGAAFTRYITEWPVGRIAREWEQFRADTHAIVAMLAERTAREETILYPLARDIEMRRAA
jgi:hypothetical protein